VYYLSLCLTGADLMWVTFRVARRCLGERCDYKAIVEHELLHALGFYNEQSRTDCDDYVQIWQDEITEGTMQA